MNFKDFKIRLAGRGSGRRFFPSWIPTPAVPRINNSRHPFLADRPKKLSQGAVSSNINCFNIIIRYFQTLFSYKFFNKIL